MDYAFLEEFLSRESLYGMADPSPVHKAASNVFWTYRDSMYLGVAKLADGSPDALSPQNYRSHYSKLARWTDNEKFGLNSKYQTWNKSFNKWMGTEARHTITIYRHENLGHDLPRGGAKARLKGPYKSFDGNSLGKYKSTEGEVLKACREGLLLLRWLTKLCGIPGGCAAGPVGFKKAAEEDLNREVKKCRDLHAALLDLM